MHSVQDQDDHEPGDQSDDDGTQHEHPVPSTPGSRSGCLQDLARRFADQVQADRESHESEEARDDREGGHRKLWEMLSMETGDNP